LWRIEKVQSLVDTIGFQLIEFRLDTLCELGV